MKALRKMMKKLELDTASDDKSRIGFLDVSLRDLRKEVRHMHSSIERIQDGSEDVRGRLEVLTCLIEDMSDELEDIRFWHTLILVLIMLAIILLAATFVIVLVLLQT